jgi:hypothetical protein
MPILDYPPAPVGPGILEPSSFEIEDVPELALLSSLWKQPRGTMNYKGVEDF